MTEQDTHNVGFALLLVPFRCFAATDGTPLQVNKSGIAVSRFIQCPAIARASGFSRRPILGFGFKPELGTPLWIVW